MLDFLNKKRKNDEQPMVQQPQHHIDNGFSYSYSTAETFGYNNSDYDSW